MPAPCFPKTPAWPTGGRLAGVFAVRPHQVRRHLNRTRQIFFRSDVGFTSRISCTQERNLFGTIPARRTHPEATHLSVDDTRVTTACRPGHAHSSLEISR